MTYLTLRRPTANPFKFYNALFTPFFARPATQEYEWRPSADISETDDSFEVRVELPGCNEGRCPDFCQRRYPNNKGRKTTGKKLTIPKTIGESNGVMGVSNGGFHFHRKSKLTASQLNSRTVS